MRDLIERLTKLTGPVTPSEALGIAVYSPWFNTANEHYFVQALTGDISSIGAAVALCERVLPGLGVKYLINLCQLPEDGLWQACLGSVRNAGKGRTPAIALILAVLKAKEAQ